MVMRKCVTVPCMMKTLHRVYGMRAHMVMMAMHGEGRINTDTGFDQGSLVVLKNTGWVCIDFMG